MKKSNRGHVDHDGDVVEAAHKIPELLSLLVPDAVPAGVRGFIVLGAQRSILHLSDVQVLLHLNGAVPGQRQG